MNNKIKKINYNYYIFLFFVSSIFCWFFEILYSLIFRSKFVLPGALYGPWCPIYGFAILFLMLFCYSKNKIIKFFKIFIILIVVEYLASIISEYLFSRIIWDYSEFLLNINGRVCLLMSLFFTVIGFIVINYIEPFFKKKYLKYKNYINILNYFFIVLLSIDFIFSLTTK